MAWQVGDRLRHNSDHRTIYTITEVRAAGVYRVTWPGQVTPVTDDMSERWYYLVNEQGERIEREAVVPPRHIIRYMVIFSDYSGDVHSTTWNTEAQAELYKRTVGDRLLGLKKLKVTY